MAHKEWIMYQSKHFNSVPSDEVKWLLGELEKQEEENKRLWKLIRSWISEYNDYAQNGDEKEIAEFIHVFRRVLIEHHIENRRSEEDGK